MIEGIEAHEDDLDIIKEYKEFIRENINNSEHLSEKDRKKLIECMVFMGSKSLQEQAN